MAYACDFPTLVIAHTGIEGSVFDHGITGESVIHADLADPDWSRRAFFSQPFDQWAKEVKVCAVRKPSPTGSDAVPDPAAD